MIMAKLYIGCGTYDGSVFSLAHESADTPSSPTPDPLKPVFVVPDAHKRSVASLAIGRSGYLVSGGSDDAIQLFSLTKRRRVGSLELHTGIIHRLKFDSLGLHLLSCAEDACVAVWRRVRVRTSGTVWDCVRQLRGHKQTVVGLAVHPSDKLALTVSTDKCLRVWDLLHGRKAFAVNLKDAPKRVEFSPDGSRYLLAYPNRLEVYLTAKGALEGSVQFELPYNDFDFFDDDKLVVAYGKQLRAYHFNAEGITFLGQAEVPVNRARLVRCVPVSPDGSDSSCRYVVVVATSNEGSSITGYRLELTTEKKLSEADLQPVFQHQQPHIRVTQLAVAWVTGLADREESNKAVKQSEDDAKEGEEEGDTSSSVEEEQAISEESSDSEEARPPAKKVKFARTKTVAYRVTK